VIRIALVLGLLALGAAAHAQARHIPADAKRGEIRHLHEMIVQIDGKALRLAPGAQIRDTANLIVVPTAIPAGALAKYMVNGQGEVFRVWILTPLEAARPDPSR
jgi:hypothetical protein